MSIDAEKVISPEYIFGLVDDEYFEIYEEGTNMYKAHIKFLDLLLNSLTYPEVIDPVLKQISMDEDMKDIYISYDFDDGVLNTDSLKSALKTVCEDNMVYLPELSDLETGELNKYIHVTDCIGKTAKITVDRFTKMHHKIDLLIRNLPNKEFIKYLDTIQYVYKAMPTIIILRETDSIFSKSNSLAKMLL